MLVWDLAYVRDQLASIGLAWALPGPAVAARAKGLGGEPPRRADVDATRAEPDAAPFTHAQANAPQHSNLEALGRGQFHPRARRPGDGPRSVRRLVILRADRHMLMHQFACSRDLAAAERGRGHTAQAVAAAAEAETVLGRLGSLPLATPDDLYDAACGFGPLVDLIGPDSDGTDPAGRERLQAQAVTVLVAPSTSASATSAGWPTTRASTRSAAGPIFGT